MISSTNNNPMLAPAQNIQLSALNADALKYLGTVVGKVIEAKVVSVSETLAGASAATDKSTAKNHADTASQRTNITADTTRANPSASKTTDQNPAARQYQIVLEVGHQKINVKSPLAPRLGQLLQLQVINYQTLALLAASARSEVVANSTAPSISTTAASPVPPPTARLQHAIQQKRPVEILQQALRNSLPREVPRESLANTYQQMLRPTAQARATAATIKTVTGALPTATATAPIAAAKTTPPFSVNSDLPGTAPANIKTATSASASASASASTITSKQNLSNSYAFATDKPLNTTLLPTNIKQSLNQLEKVIPQLNNLVRPDGVKNALLNSGIFFETRLSQLITQQGAAQTTTTNANTAAATTKTTRATLPTSPSSRAAGKEPNNAAGNNQAAKADQLLGNDLKHHFANLAATIKSTLSQSATDSATRADTLVQTQRDLLASNAAIALLWQLDNVQFKNRQSRQDNDGNDAIMQLLRLALGQLARTQNHQLQAAGSQLAAGSDAATHQTLTTELPFWYQGSVHLMDIRIDQERANKKAHEKHQAWNLRLRFDLEELGELVALATLQGKSMAAVFWASEKPLVSKLTSELKHLNNTLTELGLEVKQLHCQHGQPDNSAGPLPVNLLNTNLLQEKS